MARPVNADAQATQSKILSTAYELFSSRGMDGASVRDIAKGANVSLAMVHHYFGSKRGLYEACVEAMLQELGGLRVQLEEKLVGGASEPAAVLSEAVQLGYRYARDHAQAVRLLQRSLVDTGELDARVRDGNVVPFLDRASQLLGAIMGRSASSLRLPIQSVIFLIVRYAITSERELAALTGHADSGGPDAGPNAAVEAHLADAALRVLGFPVTRSI